MKCVVCGQQMDKKDAYLNYSKDYGICNSRSGCYIKASRKKLGKLKTSKVKISEIENRIRGSYAKD